MTPAQALLARIAEFFSGPGRSGDPGAAAVLDRAVATLPFEKAVKGGEAEVPTPFGTQKLEIPPHLDTDKIFEITLKNNIKMVVRFKIDTSIEWGI